MLYEYLDDICDKAYHTREYTYFYNTASVSYSLFSQRRE